MNYEAIKAQIKTTKLTLEEASSLLMDVSAKINSIVTDGGVQQTIPLKEAKTEEPEGPSLAELMIAAGKLEHELRYVECSLCKKVPSEHFWSSHWCTRNNPSLDNFTYNGLSWPDLVLERAKSL